MHVVQHQEFQTWRKLFRTGDFGFIPGVSRNTAGPEVVIRPQSQGPVQHSEAGDNNVRHSFQNSVPVLNNMILTHIPGQRRITVLRFDVPAGISDSGTAVPG